MKLKLKIVRYCTPEYFITLNSGNSKLAYLCKRGGFTKQLFSAVSYRNRGNAYNRMVRESAKKINLVAE